MSDDFLIIVLSFVGFFYATAVAMLLRKKTVVTMIAVLVAAFVCLHTGLLVTMSGDGRILPGQQLSPSSMAILGDTLARYSPFPHIGFTFLIALVHLLLFLQAPSRRAFWFPLPATLIFLGIFVGIRGRLDLEKPQPVREVGADRVAYLTMQPLDGNGRTRMVFSAGDLDDNFCDVLFVHESDSPPPAPPRPRLFWTKDGKGIVLMVMRKKLFAVNVESGEVVGGLPAKSHGWPRAVAEAESVRTKMILSRWRRDVDGFVRKHGGIYVR